MDIQRVTDDLDSQCYALATLLHDWLTAPAIPGHLCSAVLEQLRATIEGEIAPEVTEVTETNCMACRVVYGALCATPLADMVYCAIEGDPLAQTLINLLPITASRMLQ